jgi:hypothetical protein
MVQFKLRIAVAAEKDLEAIGHDDPLAEATIWAVLQQIKADPQLLNMLTVHDFESGPPEPFNVKRIATQQSAGRNLYRLKVWSLESGATKWRVVYGLDPRNSTYYIFGVAPRNFDYDPHHPFTRRVMASYDRLGIPTYGPR